MNINIFGATGLIGSALLQQCLDNEQITSIKIFVRKKIALQNDKLQQVITTFEGLENVASAITGDAVFNCLGTTLKQAGSQAAQYEIDCSYPVKVAQLAAANGVLCMVNVSSVGTSENGNFYLKTKADMERGVSAAIGTKAYFMRPSFLVGDRPEFRLGEKIGIYAFYGINLLLFGGLRKYRSIHANQVAKAMLNVALTQPTDKTVFHYDEMV